MRRGTFVNSSFKTAHVSSAIPFMSLNKEEILDLLEFRKILEAGSAALASERAQKQDVDEIDKALQTMLHSVHDFDEYSRADFDFHLAIAKASKNRLVHEVLNRLSVPLYSHLAEMNREFGADVSAEKHKRIFQSIRNGDVDRSEQLMRQNIQASIDMVKRATGNRFK